MVPRGRGAAVPALYNLSRRKKRSVQRGLARDQWIQVITIQAIISVHQIDEGPSYMLLSTVIIRPNCEFFALAFIFQILL